MNRYYIEGAISIKAALFNLKREVFKIIISKNKMKPDFKYIITEAEKKGVPISILEENEFNNYPNYKHTGGIIAEVGDYKHRDINYETLEGWYVYLQGIEDPFNFGYCLRSLYAAGCSGVFVDERNWLIALSTVIKSSAGASEYLPIYQIKPNSLNIFKSKGYKLVGAYRNVNSTPIHKMKFPDKFLLVVGGEKRGISRVVLNQLDYNIYIEYAVDFKMALNGSSAVSIIAFNILNELLKGDEINEET